MCWPRMVAPVQVVVKETPNDNDNTNDPDEYEDMSEGEVTPVPEDRRAACAYYMNACFTASTAPGTSHEDNARPLPPQPLVQALYTLHLAGRWWIKTTPGGLLVSFEREEDARFALRTVELARVMHGAVQVAQIPIKLPEHIHPEPDTFPTPYLIIRDVPWSIPLLDVRATLQEQDVAVTSIDRYRQHIRIQVRDPLIAEWLLHEGFNFFHVGRFAVSCLFNDNPRPANENDVTQCYRCQGFFHIAPHCRQVPRCVRCGDAHCADTCPRARSMAVCCNCAGDHHAAHKQCPVRERMAVAIPLHFTLSVKRPVPSTAPIIPDPRSDKCRCLL